jgi:hypothetical protein
MTNPENSSSDLNDKPIDYITSIVKGTLGMVPFAGSLLGELAGTVIPKQRLDRIAKFVVILESKLSNLEQDFVRSQLINENFSDLLEEGARQTTRSLSDERRNYIASLITNSLSDQDIEYIESKHLLRILSELNDIEVIWLRFYLEPTISGDEEFRDKHENILTPIMASISDSQSVLDKEALQESYKQHLSQLGLLRTKRNDYEITPLGQLLLTQIGLSSQEKG